MLTGLPVLENTDWSRLHHAYGPATDTPGYLRALLDGDNEALEEAMSHLWSAIIHQGTPWTATGPTALVVAGILFDQRLDRSESLRADLLFFLVRVAEAPGRAGISVEELETMAQGDIEPFLNCDDNDDEEALYEAGNAFYAHSILSCIEVAPKLMPVMLEGLANADPGVRMCAAMGAATLAKAESFHGRADEIERRLLDMARTTSNSDERSTYLLALGDLGFSPAAFLDDPSPAVRICAALAPGLATNSRALDQLLHALEHHAEHIDDWFVEGPPQFSMRPRFSVVKRVVRQVTDFNRLVDAAVAVVRVTSKYCVDEEWGPLLVVAFPDGNGTIKTEAQRVFLSALVKNKKLWAPGFGNAFEFFKNAGLPYDRKACAKKVKRARLER